MKKKTKTKKEKVQKIEIHIYVHQMPNWNIPNTINPNPYPLNPITNPPYIVTC